MDPTSWKSAVRTGNRGEKPAVTDGSSMSGIRNPPGNRGWRPDTPASDDGFSNTPRRTPSGSRLTRSSSNSRLPVPAIWRPKLM